MPYSYPEIRAFQGLYLQANSFQVPDGALEMASCVVLRSDNVITKTYGFYEYWRAGLTTQGEIKATYTYDDVLMGFYDHGVVHFAETFPFGGTFNGVAVPTVNTSDAVYHYSVGMNFIEENQNLYFTAMEAVVKIEGPDQKVRRAGVPPALGIQVDNYSDGYDSYGILQPNTQTGFRAVFGRRDSNGNLNLSAPSDVLIIGVPPTKVAAAYTVLSGTLTVTWPDNNFLQNYRSYVGGVNFSGIISNATNPALNGFSNGIILNVGTNVEFNSGPVANGSGTLDFTFFYSPNFYIQIPSEIKSVDDQYFIQLYRSSSSLSYQTAPFPDFQLTVEQPLTAEDIARGYVSVEDAVDDSLKGAQLYTNPNTREGDLQENSRPPLAKFLERYKGYSVFANIQTVQSTSLNLVNPEEFNGIDLIIQAAVPEVYRPVTYLDTYEDVSEFYVNITQLSPAKLDFGSHPMGATIGAKIRVNDGQGHIADGEYTVTAISGHVATLSGVATGFGGAFAQIVQASDGARLFNGYDALLWNFTTVSEWTEFVAKELAEAINGNPNSALYANYGSTGTLFPGQILLQSKFFVDPIYFRYSVAPGSPIFVQNIPDSFVTGIQYYTNNDQATNTLFVSKISEPEAVPIVNFFKIGTSSAAIVGIYAMRSSLIILKEDGVYKITGDVIDQFIVTPIDLTIQFFDGMGSPGDTINNTVIAFCNQGVVQISETSVQVISRRIEDVIQPLIGRDLSATFLTGHESERLFYVQTEGINPGSPKITWIYNVLNQSWTSTNDVYSHLSVGPKNALIGIKFDALNGHNVIERQRRSNTGVDWCGKYVIGTITIEPTAKLTGVFTITGGNVAIPEIGDVVLSNNIFNRVVGVVAGGGNYTLTFAQQTAITTSGSPTVVLYKAYESKVKMAPFHAGMVGRSKHFAQMSIHLRQQVITDLTIEFAGAYFGSSEVADWTAFAVSTAGAQGWGRSPWGLFPWGLVDGSNLVAGTEAASIIRVYVPRFAARNTFIQPILSHRQAGQPMFIQAASWSVHGYNERVSR